MQYCKHFEDDLCEAKITEDTIPKGRELIAAPNIPVTCSRGCGSCIGL